MPSTTAPLTPLQIAKRVVFGLIALVAVLGSWFIVGPGEIAVTFNRVNGATQSHSQGLHLKVPLLTSVYKFDAKTQRVDIEAQSASKDLQIVHMKAMINYHLESEKVNDLFTKVGRDYTDKLIHPITNEVIKSATAKYPVEEIIVKREELKSKIDEELKRKLAPYYIELEAVNLVNIDFDEQFNKVVEEKQIEEQKIKTAEYQKRQAEEYKQKTILEAQAEAEKQRLIKATITNDIVSLEWIKKWNGELPTTVLGDKSVMMYSGAK